MHTESHHHANLALAVQSYIVSARSHSKKRDAGAPEPTLEEMVALHTEELQSDVRK